MLILKIDTRSRVFPMSSAIIRHKVIAACAAATIAAGVVLISFLGTVRSHHGDQRVAVMANAVLQFSHAAVLTLQRKPQLLDTSANELLKVVSCRDDIKDSSIRLNEFEVTGRYGSFSYGKTLFLFFVDERGLMAGTKCLVCEVDLSDLAKPSITIYSDKIFRKYEISKDGALTLLEYRAAKP